MLIRQRSNTSPDVTRNVGVRVMLDTNSGQNDGLFRMGSQAITEEILLEQNKKQTLVNFDTLVSPNIGARIINESRAVIIDARSFVSSKLGQLVEEPGVIKRVDQEEGEKKKILA